MGPEFLEETHEAQGDKMQTPYTQGERRIEPPTPKMEVA